MKKPRTATTGKTRRWIANILLLAGVTAIDVWLWSNARTAVSQSWENWAFERETRGKSTTVTEYLAEEKERIGSTIRTWFGLLPTKPAMTKPDIESHHEIEAPVFGNGALVGRLVIPRLHLSAIVREGTGQDTLGLALGHIPGTALPGHQGNIGIAGHRDSLFRSLRKIGRSDVIELQTVGGSYSYKVETTQIVKPQNVAVLHGSGYPELTLVTCYPFNYVGSAPQRFIVKARLASER
jgi:sortase A